PTQPYRRLQQTFDVEMRSALTVNWTRGDFSATLNGNHIDDTSYSDGSARLSDWTTFDLQVGYATPWNGRVVVGARNITDEDPPTDPVGLSNPYYSNGLHDVYGRVPYIRYEQDL
ncbi:MAG: TonB-dependent receptor, partial [Gammaproteobacteria bacterium]|nr:TonB-dependent receptor [Gammaproteobacteria bacterium]